MAANHHVVPELCGGERLACQRELWTLDPSHLYFDGAGKAMLPRSSVNAGATMVALLSQPWAVPGHEQPMREVKQGYVELLGVGTPQDVAVAPSTSYALSLVASSVKLRAGQQVVCLEAQSASNVMQWQACVKRCPGSQLTVVPRPTDAGQGTWTSAVLAAIRAGDTALVALPNVHWTDGWALDLEIISDACREVAAMLCLDLTQSLGVLPFNGARVRPSVVACSVHKWLHAAHGFSLLYVDPLVLPTLAPLEEHERNRMGSDFPDWDNVGAMGRDGYPTKYFEGACRLDAGGRPSPVLVAILHASMKFVMAFGPDRIANYCRPLTQAIADCARALGYLVPPEHAPHIVGLRKPKPHPSPEPVENASAGCKKRCRDLSDESFNIVQVRDALKSRNIHASVRAGSLRLSVYLYTTDRDVQTLCMALTEVTHQLAPRIVE